MKASMITSMLGAMARTSAARISGKRLRPGWSFKFESFARSLKNTETEVRKLDPALQGDAWLERTIAQPILKQVRFDPADGIDAEWVTPKEHDGRVLLYLHGGWYSSCSSRNYREMLARITTAAKLRALVPNYRLAPQHPFPAAIDDTLAAWHFLHKQHDDIVVAGDSAGSGLAAALIIKLRDAGEELPKRAVFICPWVDLGADSGSMIEHEPFDWSDRSEVFKRVKLYLGAVDPRDPLASPVYADLSGFPPSLVQIGGAEMLLDQAVAFADKLKRDGSPVTLEITPDMIHDWHMFAALFPEGRAAIARVAEWLTSPSP